MFTSRTIIFALLSFIAGANACIKCPATLKLDGVDTKLYDTYPDNQVTFCYYSNPKVAGGVDPSVYCQYYTDTGVWLGGIKSCSSKATVAKSC
ncbi:uncharacterized protein EDB91DRAFT_1157805 [Suillus paluster]|uniref:uncharacterized protein n=1 Tax=Suillus paluster TaxID=48578 RepID=UPI001B871B0D|nr:uncharacterized protein EDB91DRAFT_1157805 [Suillus paluster]KAG1730103.1 hypothetical protein EDB91DRAFT_1157805 [Suillus paluster]